MDAVATVIELRAAGVGIVVRLPAVASRSEVWAGVAAVLDALDVVRARVLGHGESGAGRIGRVQSVWADNDVGG